MEEFLIWDIVNICRSWISPFYRNVKKNMFSISKEEFFIWCIVNMSVALVAQKKIKISFFWFAYILLFWRHKQKHFSRGITPHPHQGFASDARGGLQYSPNAQLHIRALCTLLLSVHLNNWSIKKTLFQPPYL